MMHHITKRSGPWRCGDCGWLIPDQEKPWRATCPVCAAGDGPREWRPIMVGDMVEKALTRIGITKARVERWTRTAGKPGGCGCEARKKWLNEWGNEKQRKLRSVLLKARRFYVGS